jgi:3-oxoacyl-[acyl-carrier protein] reductase
MCLMPETASSIPTRIHLITGANGGLGIATARAFLSDTENFVWLGVNRQRTSADALITEFPNRAACVDLDVTSNAAWDAAIHSILERHSRIDVLVNNAGRHEDGLLATMAPEQWQRVIDLNLTSTYLGCHAVVRPMMSQRHGRIVNVSSLSALLAPLGQTNYAAAKAGVVALTQSLAKEVARAGITVNAVCPGYIETDAIQAMPPEEKSAKTSVIPMRRFGKPSEVAAAIRFLASTEASYITGAVLKIDGGIF